MGCGLPCFLTAGLRLAEIPPHPPRPACGLKGRGRIVHGGRGRTTPRGCAPVMQAEARGFLCPPAVRPDASFSYGRPPARRNFAASPASGLRPKRAEMHCPRPLPAGTAAAQGTGTPRPLSRGGKTAHTKNLRGGVPYRFQSFLFSSQVTPLRELLQPRVLQPLLQCRLQ